MIEENARIVSNQCIARNVYKMVLETKIANTAQPGQFIQVQVPGFFLRRPISIASIDPDKVTLIYKTVGAGTDVMHKMKEGDALNLFGPLGHGFPIEDRDVLLLGGGVGLPPLYETAKQYRKHHQKVTVAAGFASQADIFLANAFKELGCTFLIATDDGSAGIKGTVLDAVKANNVKTDFVLACGPLGMLKAVNAAYDQGYISIESRMACGIGVCNGCVMKDNNGNSVRVCCDGPVFPIGKVVL